MNTQTNSHRRGLSALLAVAVLTGAPILPALAATKTTCDLPNCPLTVAVVSNAKQTVAPMRDYPVTVGKRTVMASTLTPRLSASPVSVAPTEPRDYPVLIGKRTVMASQVVMLSVKNRIVAQSSGAHCSTGQFVTTGKMTRYITTCSLKGTSKALPCCS